MSRSVVVPAVVLCVVLGLVMGPGAYAHGGNFTAPAAPSGASWGAGAKPGGPSRAASPPSGPSGASTGAGSSTPSGAPGKSWPRTGGPPAENASAGWQFWWEFNKDQYLDLKSRRTRLASRGANAGHLTGRGRRADPDLFVRPDPAVIRGQVLPLLIRLLDDEQDRDILDSCMLALARSADEDTAPFVIDAIEPFLAHKDRVVQCAAALSLGVLGSPRAVPTLTLLLRDTSKGRTLARATGPLDQSLRACAAIGLGLVNAPESVEALCAQIERTEDSEVNLKSCAITALGLMDNESGLAALGFLLGLLGDPQLDPPIQSQVPIAIGRLCARMGLSDPTVERALLAAFLARDTDDRVRQSLAIALGLVGTIPSDELAQNPVLRALLDECAQGRSDDTRQFCFIAVAQIGRGDTAPSEHPRLHQQLTALFVEQCLRPTVAADRSWAALGAAIYGQEHGPAQAALVEGLRAAWAEEHDPSYKGAFALALGLLDAGPHADELFDDFNAQKDQELNGFTALSLGFMECMRVSDTLRALCRSQTILPLYRMRLATALALLADDGTDEALIELLGEGHAMGVNAAAAKALGLVGGAPALTTLQALAADEREPELARAFACVALGMICEKTELPWNARLAADCNFRTLAPALREVLDIL